MNPPPPSENRRWLVTCEDAEDGIGDLIIPLPDDLLAAIGLTSGDKLNMEKQPDGTITLTVRHQHDAETLLGVLADLYHVCGMLDAKVEVLDQIMAALNGEPLPYESLGPYVATDEEYR